MKKCGLLGKNISYSKSKEIHEAFGLYDYEIYDKSEEELPAFFGEFKKNNSMLGINVTIPYKQNIVEYCDLVSPRVMRIGAANTVYKMYVEGECSTIADNTDYEGFEQTLKDSGVSVKGKKILILGRGGAAKCIEIVLRDNEAGQIIKTSRKDLEHLANYKDSQIVINATPVGTAMTEFEGKSPCDLTIFKNLEAVFDLVYNPEETPLLKQAKELGVTYMNGLTMLKTQAEKSAKLFITNSPIIIVGMPGCGKTTFGKLLAEKTYRPFLDTDKLIEQILGRTPADIIKTDGEAAFRKIESDILKKAVGSCAIAVIATGGGAVTVEENRELFKNNITIWLQRDLDKLDKKGRPLSTDLEKLYEIREPLYKESARFIVDNNYSVHKAAEKTAKDLKLI